MVKFSLHSANLDLVPTAPEDLEAVFAACQDPEIQRWVPIPVPYLRKHALEYLTTHTDKTWDEGTEYTWTLRTDGKLAGVVDLYRLGNGSGDLGFWMDPAFRGRGLVTEACTAVLDFSLAEAPEGLAWCVSARTPMRETSARHESRKNWASISREPHGWALPCGANFVTIGAGACWPATTAASRLGRSPADQNVH
ncbi:GNAT family N-acetyltransferase [Paeniglutamicibacter antarcticus]|uniref:N-acetyltransferase domain-containing protein n=1 Tax=Paeniglutamicibacter antarcticus TaxID=494023 RepID=A0ABP9TIW4_9MICC